MSTDQEPEAPEPTSPEATEVKPETPQQPPTRKPFPPSRRFTETIQSPSFGGLVIVGGVRQPKEL
jgi:hypothetical protein